MPRRDGTGAGMGRGEGKGGGRGRGDAEGPSARGCEVALGSSIFLPLF
jgi:hypothetical protein